MNTQERRDLKFSGNMTTPGGVYKRVEINGDVTFDGDLDCLDFRVNGAGKVTHNLKSGNTIIKGNTEINGDVEGGEFEVHGQGTVDGNVEVDKIKAHGMLGVRGDVKAETLNVYGQLSLRGNCDAEVFICSGAFEIEGTLNAGDVTINLYGTARVKEVVGGKIIVQKARGDKLGKFFAVITNPLNFYKTQLTTDTIEGDEIAIEHTMAKVVRGETITIGDGCEIDLVEYRGTFSKASGASVLKHVKI
jgi:cytoskeletal protein CcmA (bactofilin family)